LNTGCLEVSESKTIASQLILAEMYVDPFLYITNMLSACSQEKT